MTFALDKKGVSIIATVAIMLILSLLGLTGVSLLGSASSAGLAYMQAQQSLYIAEAGLNWYMEQLQNDTDWSDNANLSSVNFAGGIFTISVSNAQIDSIDASSASSVTGYESQPIRRVVTAHLTRSLKAFDYVIYAGGSINDSQAVNLSINGDQQEGVPTEDLPVVDFPYYEEIAPNKIYANHTFTSAGSPYSGLWYIDGNVTVDSNVTINGGIIATGNIGMKNKSNINISASSPYPALVSQGNFQLQGASNVNISGLIYVGADMTGNSLWQQSEDITVTGVIIVAGNLDLQQSEDVTINYQAPASMPGFSGPSSINYSTWKEVI